MAIIGGLALCAAAGIVAVQSFSHRSDAPRQAEAGLPIAVPTGTTTVGAEEASAPTVSASPAAPTTRATAAGAAAPPTPARSTASQVAAVPAAKSSTQSGPITGYTACATASTAQFAATFTVSYSWHHVFINSDADAATGYRVPKVRNGFGADFMMENGTLYRSTGSAWGWTALGGSSPLLSSAGGTYRWRVPLNALGTPDEPLVVVFNGSGTSTEANSPVLTTGGC